LNIYQADVIKSPSGLIQEKYDYDQERYAGAVLKLVKEKKKLVGTVIKRMEP